MTAICQFCNKDLGEIFISSDDEAPFTNGRPTSHDCTNCNTRYVYRRDGSLYGYVIWTYHNNKKYGAHFYNKIAVALTANGWQDVYFRLTQDGIVELFTLDFYPDINPTNFQKKLPTMLAFL